MEQKTSHIRHMVDVAVVRGVHSCSLGQHVYAKPHPMDDVKDAARMLDICIAR
jgi:hypothetical protein